MEKVGQITKSQAIAIAQEKIKDLNAVDVERAALMIEGTARSMGVTVVEG
jgi:large subunit ribosomal protein L11